jgi:histidinol-phosphatase
MSARQHLTMSSEGLESLLEFACETVWEAGRLTLAHFQTVLDVQWKADRSPVTAADRAAEAWIRRAIETRFPDHAIVGEELGPREVDATYRWWVDPIDGTQAFIAGVPLYGVLLGLERAGEIVVGAVCFPALGELVAAGIGLGCRWNGRRARVSAVDRLGAARVVFTDCGELDERHETRWRRLRGATRVQRGWGDCYGHCLVATGRAEIAVDPIMQPWDCAALVPILREAGGTFTDWQGRTTIHAGEALSTNGVLLDQVLALLRA